MKFTLTIAFLVLITVTKAQTLADIEKRLKLLGDQGQIPFDTTGFSRLSKVKYLCNAHFEDNEFPEGTNTMDYYHVVDLNNDGLNDLIYSGPCLPYDQTGIFLNEDNTLKLVHDHPGKIIGLEKRGDKTILDILKEPCCCDYYATYYQVTIDNNSRVDKNHITFFASTEVKLDNLRQLKVSGTLRTSPEVNDKEEKDICSNRVFKGNHLTYIEHQTTVTQLKQSGQWRLVLYTENKTHSWIGWILVDP